ncbi:MAG: hypoxanthine phosphoribosyltransferase [Dehalococcoidales bacterium]|nr:hypoxanthine phosphoribosyltransferase [Dehalococcoidales bacterium]MDD3264660.1 hypoxanthine phosphoribosyltransferase [Dehalococcoidales bacterium]MDD4322494.1 hypoxanthine phosphoribosyltransferase [Dehalococcoidales bacterium]MDD4793834.1 hypoxanthine phosphoribosyltransferase [Dehalococcoidales bacterium]MDD5497906.1 hypoxanthine phosphoribosyltransferase [Dehalococcoidales bacterium]
MSKKDIYSDGFYKVLSFAASNSSLKEKLNFMVNTTAELVGGSASLILLDSSGSQLIPAVTCKLPKFYIQKGLLDRFKSLDEIDSGRAVIINNVNTDERVQFKDIAKKARITAIAGAAINIGGNPAGSLRIYLRDNRVFSGEDVDLIQRMAELAALTIAQHHLCQVENSNRGFEELPSVIRQIRETVFAHPSEAEFASLLDFYNIEWVYEPRSFVLNQDGNRVTEMFSPDFYLPGLDLYVEITTLKQSLITYKNRKLRRLRELYPEIKIILINKNNYDRLLSKYGAGPLGQARAHGIRKILYSAEKIKERVDELAAQISADYEGKCPVLLGVQRGFICFMADLIRQISVPMDMDFMAINRYRKDSLSRLSITKDADLDISGRHVLLVEDIVDTGMTLSSILDYLKSRKPASLEVCTLLNRKARRLMEVDIRYWGFEIPDEFVVGYGLDYREEYRNLPFIGVPIILDEKKEPVS